MTDLHAYMTSAEIRAWGWALLNFLWQGSLVAATLKGALALLRRRSAQLRYGVAATTLALMFFIPLVSFWKPHLPSPAIPNPTSGAVTFTEAREASPVQTGAEALTSTVSNPQAAQRSPGPRPFSSALESILPWVCILWFFGAILSGIRSLAGLLEAQQLKRTAAPATGYSNFLILMRRSRVWIPVEFLESARVSVPTVIGWLRPAVLLPSGCSLEPASNQALLAHELAHVRRRDYLVNLLQAVVEIVLFFHPAVWWVSRQVRMERECCCDDDAVAVCGNLLTYVRALSEAEQCRSASKLAVAVSGTPLLNRIRRLTEMRTQKSNRIVVGLAGLFAVVLIMATAAGSALLAYVPVRFEQAQPALQATPPVAQPLTQSKVQQPVPTKTQTEPATASAPAPELSPNAPRSQTSQGQQTLTGRIYDPVGAVMPGVVISILDAGTKEVLGTVYSQSAGQFEIALPQQDFALQFTAPGFRTVGFKRADLEGGNLTVNMQLGEISETVKVTAAAEPQSPWPAGGKVKPIRVGGSVYWPKLVQKVLPVYPEIARAENVEGTVVISALIDEQGFVKNPVVLSGHILLNNAALEAASQFRFSPALLDGEPWPVRFTFQVDFRLSR